MRNLITPRINLLSVSGAMPPVSEKLLLIGWDDGKYVMAIGEHLGHTDEKGDYLFRDGEGQLIFFNPVFWSPAEFSEWDQSDKA